MRYIKVLLLGLFIFLALLFFFQNQVPLSQDMTMTLNLFFWAPFTSIPMPFYFIVIAAFLIGCALAVCFLLWDKFNTSAKLVKTRWRVSSLEKENTQLKAKLEALQEKEVKALEAAKPAEVAKLS